MTLGFPEYDTGRFGRGILGRWGPNRAADVIVTRLEPGTEQIAQLDFCMEGKSGLQVAVMWREQDQCWALPGASH